MVVCGEMNNTHGNMKENSFILTLYASIKSSHDIQRYLSVCADLNRNA
jgi:hypothetical protein